MYNKYDLVGVEEECVIWEEREGECSIQRFTYAFVLVSDLLPRQQCKVYGNISKQRQQEVYDK